ncbi:MAG: hypothetical protein ABS76_07470 [Pelagibacterium sp. SCN 64-44]|nr:MAG: hypothetical protein ABS76_07470 [Pelagibacterium sp. SCN 64-44]
MARQPRPGLLRGRVHLQQRGTGIDPYTGQPREGDFATVTTVAAEFIPLKGSEPVIASRLQGVQPYVVRVRSSAATRAVDETWRLVDARAPQPPDAGARVFAIKAPPTDPDQKRQWVEWLVEIGRPE